jgi:hypothetical protein
MVCRVMRILCMIGTIFMDYVWSTINKGLSLRRDVWCVG